MYNNFSLVILTKCYNLDVRYIHFIVCVRYIQLHIEFNISLKDKDATILKSGDNP